MKYEYAQTDWLKDRISLDDLENNMTFNPTLVFAPKSPDYPLLKELQRTVLSILQETSSRTGLRPPIAEGPKREPASRRNLETLLANVIVAQACHKKSIAVPHSPNAYADTHLTAGIIDLYQLMYEAKLIARKKGFYTEREKRLTRIQPRATLRRLIAGIGSDAAYSEPNDLINLRAKRQKGERTGKFIPREKWPVLSPEENQKLKRLQMCLQWFNLVLGEYKIDYRSEANHKRLMLHPVLYASFNGDFQQGGRFYTGRGGHTNRSKAERATIRFDGHETTELDFGGLHIRMLYDLNGTAFPFDRDPYDMVLRHLRLNAESIFRKFPEIRDDLKVMLLALVNDTAKGEVPVQRAKWRLFNQWIEEQDPEARERAKREAELREERWGRVGMTVEKVINGFKGAHAPIADEFSTGSGLRLQNIDAEIARNVMVEMMVNKIDECLPTLPVHDSFITFTAFAPKLERAMQQSYRAVMSCETGRRGPFRIPVKWP